MRACVNCGTEIKAANGFVFAGDWHKAMCGDLDPALIRERCGKCQLRMDVPVILREMLHTRGAEARARKPRPLPA